ncbi:large ribosomal subunit protein mL52 [Ascaphus truei]|uniref:large ribosomal subunit protein mL52 n=1 Tax=Ascaphus truei TaxID=8439 RepID=UPI003F59A02A
MAAPMLVRPLQVCAGHWSGAVPAGGWRCLWTSAALSAGKAWRLRHGFAPSGSEYGPLTDLPDWSFADGRPGVPWKGQIRRKEECEAMAVSVSRGWWCCCVCHCGGGTAADPAPLLRGRVVLLSTEMDVGLETWHEQQRELSTKQLEKERNQLKAKAHP